MEDKERQRTISQGSLDGCIITRDNQLIKASNNTMNRLIQQETMASLAMKRFISRRANHTMTGSGTTLHVPGKLNGHPSPLAFCTRRGTDPSINNGTGMAAAAAVGGAATGSVYEPGATGSLPMSRSTDSACSSLQTGEELIDPWSNSSESAPSVAVQNEAIEQLRRDLARPMYRKDILYSGSMHHVAQFDASPTVRTYVRSTTSMPGSDDASCWDHCPYSEPVTNVFKEMLDPCLFKSYTFVLLCIAAIATMLGEACNARARRGVGR